MNANESGKNQTTETGPTQAARQRMRQLGRRVLAQPRHTTAHRKRMDAALMLEGIEPLQGCLVDLFHAIDPHHAAPLFEQACTMARAHLPPHVAQVFELQSAQGGTLEAIHVLATRWSVLVQPSATVPARMRRASGDESRRLAQRVVQALQEAGPAAETVEQEFLAHCLACNDRLAFMLARREWLRQHPMLNPQWQAVALQLERDGVTA